MRKLHITYVYGDLGESSGGLGIDIRAAANWHAERGHDVRVATMVPPRSGSGWSDDLMVDVFTPRPRWPPLYRYGLAGGLRGRLRNVSCDVVHLYSWLPSYFQLSAVNAARGAGSALVWTPMMHPARALMWSSYRLGRLMRLFDDLAPAFARRCDAIVAATQEEAEYFRSRGCQRVELIPPGVPVAPLLSAHDAAAFRRRYKIGSDPVVLVVAARDERRKGLDFAFEVFACLQSAIPAARLVIAGIIELASGKDGGIRMLGRLSAEDLTLALRAADVVFVPSRYEAFSRVVIEAWQQATPVVVTDRVGLSRIVVHERGGRVVPFGDTAAACAALIQELRKPAAEAEVHRVRWVAETSFGLSNLLPALEATYAEIARG